MAALKNTRLDRVNTGADDCVKELRFRRLLTTSEWAGLPATTTARFGKYLADGQTKHYHGHVLNTDMNFFGKCLSTLMRLFNAPLPLETKNTGAEAHVTVTGEHGAQIWNRKYNSNKGAAQLISSRKQFTGPTGLEEMLGYGIGMTLKLSADADSIYFTADRFFMTFFGRRVYLPSFATPGHLIITHTDLGNGNFCFGMTLTHRLFGNLVNQNVLFTDA